MLVLESLFASECLIYWILNPMVFSFYSKFQHLLKLPANRVLFTILVATFVVVWNINFYYSRVFFPRKALLKEKQRLNFFKLLPSLNSKEKGKKLSSGINKKNIATKNNNTMKLMITSSIFCPTCLLINIDPIVGIY